VVLVSVGNAIVWKPRNQWKILAHSFGLDVVSVCSHGFTARHVDSSNRRDVVAFARRHVMLAIKEMEAIWQKHTAIVMHRTALQESEMLIALSLKLEQQHSASECGGHARLLQMA
jgi:hypothetical protein